MNSTAGLGKGTEIEDTCDWLKFQAEGNGTMTISGLGENDTVKIGNAVYYGDTTFDIKSGTDYKICISRNPIITGVFLLFVEEST